MSGWWLSVVVFAASDTFCYWVARMLGYPWSWGTMWMPASGYYMLYRLAMTQEVKHE